MITGVEAEVVVAVDIEEEVMEEEEEEEAMGLPHLGGVDTEAVTAGLGVEGTVEEEMGVEGTVKATAPHHLGIVAVDVAADTDKHILFIGYRIFGK